MLACHKKAKVPKRAENEKKASDFVIYLKSEEKSDKSIRMMEAFLPQRLAVIRGGCEKRRTC